MEAGIDDGGALAASFAIADDVSEYTCTGSVRLLTDSFGQDLAFSMGLDAVHHWAETASITLEIPRANLDSSA
jgi:hypothetical protein